MPDRGHLRELVAFIDHVTACQLNFRVVPRGGTTPSGMTKRKAKKTTLTNIDPSLLKPKTLAISQHATSNGARVTTPIRPAHKTPPRVDPVILDFDPSTFDREWLEAEVDEEDTDEEDFISRVRPLPTTEFEN
jgi:hypothetical protein